MLCWSKICLCGHWLYHLEQEECSNQCVICSTCMLERNTKSFFARGEDEFLRLGKISMQACCDRVFEDMPDKDFIATYGVNYDAIFSFFQRCGFREVREVKTSVYGPEYVCRLLNGMRDGDGAILSCGADTFHALCCFKKHGCTFVLNSMSGGNQDYKGCAYKNGKPVVCVSGEAVYFCEPCDGGGLFWAVDSVYFFPHGCDTFGFFRRGKARYHA